METIHGLLGTLTDVTEIGFGRVNLMRKVMVWAGFNGRSVDEDDRVPPFTAWNCTAEIYAYDNQAGQVVVPVEAWPPGVRRPGCRRPRR